MNITSENLYEKTQSEVESNFFPGTHKKASFLTTLSRNLITEITKVGKNQNFALLSAFYSGLNGRHIQIYLHNEPAQTAFSKLMWDGAVAIPACGDDCYADMFGIVEANVGVNKVNYFITRNIKLDITLNGNVVNHKLTLSLQNSANPALGLSSRYRDYIRILIPSDASLTSPVVYNGATPEYLTPDTFSVKGHKEVGVFIELLAGSTKNLEFTWTSGLGNADSYKNYGIYIRKQAGTDDDPININIDGMGPQISPDPRLVLTRQGSYKYNTNLANDLFLRLSF
jgi:hypothetical protein